MECTCSLGLCEPHTLITGPPRPRRALSSDHINVIRRYEDNDYPEDQTHLSRDETRLLFEAWEIQGALRTGDWPAA